MSNPNCDSCEDQRWVKGWYIWQIEQLFNFLSFQPLWFTNLSYFTIRMALGGAGRAFQMYEDNVTNWYQWPRQVCSWSLGWPERRKNPLGKVDFFGLGDITVQIQRCRASPWASWGLQACTTYILPPTWWGWIGERFTCNTNSLVGWGKKVGVGR